MIECIQAPCPGDVLSGADDTGRPIFTATVNADYWGVLLVGALALLVIAGRHV